MEPKAPVSVQMGSLLRAGVCLFLAFLGHLVFFWFLSPLGVLLAAVFTTFAAATLANVLALRIYERGHLDMIGLYWTSSSARNLLWGMLGGVGAATVILGGALLTGAAYWKSDPDPAANGGTVFFISLVLLFGAVSEEVLFRGYAFQVLVPVFGAWATILPMGVLFGMAHAWNQNVTGLGLANTIAWGFVLGYAVLRSGDLWLAIGLHFGWNWALPLFGVYVSGFRIKVTSYRLVWNLADIWGGGDYGPEGGLLCTGILILLSIYLVRAPIRQQQLPLVRVRQEEVV